MGLTFLWGFLNMVFLAAARDTVFSLNELISAVWLWKQGWIQHLWFMGTLVCIYVFFPLLKVAFDQNRQIFFYFLAAAAILTFGNTAISIFITIASHYLTGSEGMISQNWFNMFNPFAGIYGYAFVYFCAGGCGKELLSLVQKNRRRSNWIAGITIPVSMGLLFVMGVILSKIRYETWSAVWNGYDTVFTFANVIALFVLASNYQGKHFRTLVVTISRNTLGIYFVHVMVKELLMPWAMKVPYWYTFPGSMGLAAAILAGSLGVVLVLRKIPLLKKLL